MNNTVIRGKPGWCSLIWSCIIFLPCHLLYNFPPNTHFPFFWEMLLYERTPLGCWSALGRVWQPHSSSPHHQGPTSGAPGVFLPLSTGMDESPSLLGSAFWASDFDFLRDWILHTARERISEINLQCGGNVTPIQKLLYQSSPLKGRATSNGEFCVKISDLHSNSHNFSQSGHIDRKHVYREDFVPLLYNITYSITLIYNIEFICNTVK